MATDDLSLVPELSTDSSGARYLAAPVSPGAAAPYLAELTRMLGTDRVRALREAKAGRDGPDEYHVTNVSPPEFEEVGEDWSRGPHRAQVLGLGRQAVGDAECYFVVLVSAGVQSFRRALGLPPCDLHLTLGFWPHDVYGRPKDASTVIGQLSQD